MWKATIQHHNLQPFKNSKKYSTHGEWHRNRQIILPGRPPCYNCSKNHKWHHITTNNKTHFHIKNKKHRRLLPRVPNRALSPRVIHRAPSPRVIFMNGNICKNQYHTGEGPRRPNQHRLLPTLSRHTHVRKQRHLQHTCRHNVQHNACSSTKKWGNTWREHSYAVTHYMQKHRTGPLPKKWEDFARG